MGIRTNDPRRRLQKLADELTKTPDGLEQLGVLQKIEKETKLSRVAAVKKAQAKRATWAEIGDALGTSKQAAHKRWSKEL